MSKANEELVEISRRSEPSVLRKRSYEGMSDENWMTEVMNELSTRCPVVSDILSKLLDIMYLTEKKIPINTILLTQGHASTNVSSNCLFMLILYNCLA